MTRKVFLVMFAVMGLISSVEQLQAQAPYHRTKPRTQHRQVTRSNAFRHVIQRRRE